MSAPAPDAPPGLRTGTLTTADVSFFVVSAAAPLTVMAGVAPVAILLGGVGAPVGYLLAGLTLTVFAVGFTTMSRHVRSAGAFYAYIARGLGTPIGIAAALVAMLGYNGMEIGVYGLLGSATSDTAAALGHDVPWLPVSLAGLLLVWYGGYRSIDFGAKVLGVLLVAETGILVLLAGGVLLDGGAHGSPSAASPPPTSSPAAPPPSWFSPSPPSPASSPPSSTGARPGTPPARSPAPPTSRSPSSASSTPSSCGPSSRRSARTRSSEPPPTTPAASSSPPSPPTSGPGPPT